MFIRPPLASCLSPPVHSACCLGLLPRHGFLLPWGLPACSTSSCWQNGFSPASRALCHFLSRRGRASSSRNESRTCGRHGEVNRTPFCLPCPHPATSTITTMHFSCLATSISDAGGVSEPSELFEEMWRSVGVTPEPPPIVLFSESGNERGLMAGRAGVGKGDVLISVPIGHTIAVSVVDSNSGLVFLEDGSSLTAPPGISTVQTIAGEDGGKSASMEAEWRELVSVFEVRALEAERDSVDAGGESGLNCETETAVRLAVQLLRELQNERSPWRTYLPLLPKSFDSALLWSPAELDVLHWDAAKCAALAAQERLEAMAAAVELLFSAADASRLRPITRDFARWAVLVVLTRSFTTQWNATPVQMLVPLADMINHAPSTTAPSTFEGSAETWPVQRTAGAASAREEDGEHAADSGSLELPRGEREEIDDAPWAICQACAASPARFEIRASSDLKAGEEVTISYGPYSSVDLLLNYGFVPDNNPSDRLPLYDDLQEMMDDARCRVRLLQRKMELLLSMHPSAGPLFLFPWGIADRLYGCLVVLYAQDREDLAELERVWAELPAARHVDASLFVRAVSASSTRESGFAAARALARAHIARRSVDLRSELGVENRGHDEIRPGKDPNCRGSSVAGRGGTTGMNHEIDAASEKHGLREEPPPSYDMKGEEDVGMVAACVDESLGRTGKLERGCLAGMAESLEEACRTMPVREEGRAILGVRDDAGVRSDSDVRLSLAFKLRRTLEAMLVDAMRRYS